MKQFWRLVGENPSRINSQTFQMYLDGQLKSDIPTDPLEQWTAFYDQVFGIDFDPADVQVPDNPGNFDRIIYMAQGLTYDAVQQAQWGLCKSWKYSNKDLPELVDMSKEARTTEIAYAIRVRDSVEADEIHKNKSAEMLAEQEVGGQTLLERLVHGMFFYWVTGKKKHLNYYNITLCTGSRYRDGGVPFVDFFPGDGSVHVHWCGVQRRRRGLRVREVVS